MSLLPTTTDALAKRLVEITYQERLSHLSSTLSALPIVEEIYAGRRTSGTFSSW